MRTSRRSLQRRFGLALMVGSIALSGAAIQLAPAGATAQAEDEPVALEVTKQAIYVTTAGRAAPDTLTSEFPPGFLCVLVPQVCPDELAPVGDAVAGVTQQVENGPEEPQAVTPQDSLPVSISGGETHYESAVQFTLPEVPSGQEIDEFVLRLEAISPTYHTSSPQFRQAVLAVFASIASRSPEQEEFQKALEANPVDFAPIGIEACPVVGSFAEGTQGEEAKPEIDCIFGSNGVYIGDNGNQAIGYWEFDLTFAAKEWAEGTLANEGVFLRPTNAPNLAFGDPDSSTHAQVTFSNSVAATVTTTEAAPPPAALPPLTTGGTSSSQPLTTGNAFSAPANVPLEPSVADGPEQPQTAPAEPAQGELVTAGLETEPAGSAWWIWLLVPVFLAGMYLTAQSLTTEVVLAAERQGAMSRLIELNETRRGS